MNSKSWICTFSGEQFDPFDPDPAKIKIEDIAHALSNICRFTGHSKVFYSVAEHSVWASRYAPMDLRLAALLHDASEAYLMDLARPIKHHPDMKLYREVEQKVEQAVATKFGTPYPMLPEIKLVDNRLLISEAQILLPNTDDWNWPTRAYEDFEEACIGWKPKMAEFVFLRRFDELKKEQQRCQGYSQMDYRTLKGANPSLATASVRPASGDGLKAPSQAGQSIISRTRRS
jgi:hypothetical protein